MSYANVIGMLEDAQSIKDQRFHYMALACDALKDIQQEALPDELKRYSKDLLIYVLRWMIKHKKFPILETRLTSTFDDNKARQRILRDLGERLANMEVEPNKVTKELNTAMEEAKKAHDRRHKPANKVVTLMFKLRSSKGENSLPFTESELRGRGYGYREFKTSKKFANWTELLKFLASRLFVPYKMYQVCSCLEN